MSIGQDANGNKFKATGSIVGMDDEEELQADDDLNQRDRNFNLKQTRFTGEETMPSHPMHSKGLAA